MFAIMKKYLSLILLVISSLIIAQVNPTDFPEGLITKPTSNYDGVPTLGQIKDSVNKMKVSDLLSNDNNIWLSYKPEDGLAPFSIYPDISYSGDTITQRKSVQIQRNTKGGMSLFNTINDFRCSSDEGGCSYLSSNLVYGLYPLENLSNWESSTTAQGGGNSVFNTAFGTQALRAMIKGGYNTAVGNFAGSGAKEVDSSILIGSRTANLISTGKISGTTIVGNERFTATTDLINQIIISDGRGLSNGTGIGFRVLTDGTTTIPRQTIATYNNDSTGKAVVTKEIIDLIVPKPPATGCHTLQSNNGVTSWIPCTE